MTALWRIEASYGREPAHHHGYEATLTEAKQRAERIAAAEIVRVISTPGRTIYTNGNRYHVTTRHIYDGSAWTGPMTHSRCIRRAEPCSTCHGTGEITVDESTGEPCPRCDGTGDAR